MRLILITWPPQCHRVTWAAASPLCLSVWLFIDNFYWSLHHKTCRLWRPINPRTHSSLSYRSGRAGWRCSGSSSAPPDSPCSRSSSSFLPRRTSGEPWPADGGGYPVRRGGGGPEDRLSCRMTPARVHVRCCRKYQNQTPANIPLLLVWLYTESQRASQGVTATCWPNVVLQEGFLLHPSFINLFTPHLYDVVTLLSCISHCFRHKNNCFFFNSELLPPLLLRFTVQQSAYVRFAPIKWSF